MHVMETAVRIRHLYIQGRSAEFYVTPRSYDPAFTSITYLLQQFFLLLGGPFVCQEEDENGKKCIDLFTEDFSFKIVQ